MSSEVKLITYWVFWQIYFGIIESVIGGIIYNLQVRTLSFYTKNHCGYSCREDNIWWNVVYCWILLHEYLFLPLCVLLEETRGKNNVYTSFLNNQITTGSAIFSSSNGYALQHCTVWSNKSSVTVFPKGTAIVFLYYSTISDTYSLVSYIQSIIVITYSKVHTIK